MVSPLHKRRAVQAVVALGLCSQRRACRYLDLHRSSGRYQNKGPSDWLLGLREQIEALSRKYPRLGYRKLTRLLMAEGWKAGKKLVQRIRRECGLRVKRWLPRPRRRGRSTGTIPTRAERLNHVWSWDFVADRTDNGG
jgi:putative transposase